MDDSNSDLYPLQHHHSIFKSGAVVITAHLHNHIRAKMSNQEQYVPSNNATLITAPGGGSAFNEPSNKPTTYVCGDCGAKVPIRRGDAIRCKECGYRVLYKERTNRSVEEHCGEEGFGADVWQNGSV